MKDGFRSFKILDIPKERDLFLEPFSTNFSSVTFLVESIPKATGISINNSDMISTGNKIIPIVSSLGAIAFRSFTIKAFIPCKVGYVPVELKKNRLQRSDIRYESERIDVML